MLLLFFGEGCFHFLSFRQAHYLCYLLDSGFANALEVCEQCIARLRTYSVNVIESRGYLPLAALVAVVGDTEAVSLVAQVLDESQRL